MARAQSYSAYKAKTGKTEYKGIYWPYGPTGFWDTANKSTSKPVAPRTGKHKKVLATKATKSSKPEKATKSTKEMREEIKKMMYEAEEEEDEFYKLQQKIIKIDTEKLLKKKYKRGVSYIKQNMIIEKELTGVIENTDDAPDTVLYFNNHFGEYIAHQIDYVFNVLKVDFLELKAQYVAVTQTPGEPAEFEMNPSALKPGHQEWKIKWNEISRRITPKKWKKIKKDLKNKTFTLNDTLIGASIKAFLLGYSIMFETLNKKQAKQLKKLRAFHPSSCRKFHEACTVSTSEDGKLCIYETFRHIFIKSIKNKHRDTEKFNDMIKTELNKEGSEIETAVNNGELINSLQLLTKKYNTKTLIKFYKEAKTFIEINNGEVNETPDISAYYGKEIYLYDGNHVAPSLLINQTKPTYTNKSEKIIIVMKPNENKKIRDDKIINYFEYETEQDKNGYHSFKNIKINDNDTYADINTLCDYFDTFQRVDAQKTRKGKRDKRNIFYSWGNASSINIHMLPELIKRDPAVKYYFRGGDVPVIKYRSIEIRDITLFDVKKCDMTELYDGVNMLERVKMHHNKYSTGEIKGRKFQSNAHTPATLALNIYNQCFQENTLYSSPNKIYEYERESYHGSIVDCNYTGKYDGDIYVYDINSSYSACMKKYAMPYMFKKLVEYKKPIKDNCFFTSNLYYANITETDKSNNKKCSRPLNVWAWVWGVELKMNVKNGFMAKFTKEIKYEARAGLFDSYIDHFYKCKNDGDKLAKLMLNSLQGKFGQKNKKEYQYIPDVDNFQYNQEFKNVVDFQINDNNSAVVAYETNEEYSTGRLVRLTSFICACARVELFNGMQSIDLENFLYADTDSVISKVPMPAHMIDQKKLGAWKLEKFATSGIFIGKKIYHLDGVIKDVNKCAGLEMNKKQYEEIIKDGSTKVKKVMTFRNKFGEIQTREVTKELKI